MKRYIRTGILAVFLCCLANTDAAAANAGDIPKDTVVRILTYGLPNWTRDRASNVVAIKYGFQYYAVAGCVVTKDLTDSVKRENDIALRILEKRLGKNWEKRFEEDVDKMIARLDEVEKLVRKERYIIDKEQELEKDQKELQFLIAALPLPLRQKEHESGHICQQFDVKAYGWEGDACIMYYRMQVELDRKNVKLISSKPERFDIQ